LAHILASGPGSRLHRRLIEREQLASSVSADVWSREIGGSFSIIAEALPGKPLEIIDQAIAEELDRLLRHGPTEQEVARAATAQLNSIARSSEAILAKANLLGDAEATYGDPAGYLVALRNYASATPADVQEAGRRWLKDGSYTLELRPLARRQVAASGADRSAIPPIGAPTAITFPDQERTVLSNGLRVVLVRRPSAPTVNLELIIGAGSASEQPDEAGTALLAMNLLSQGARGQDAEQIRDELTTLGGTLSTTSGPDTSSISLSVLPTTLEPSLRLLSNIARQPTFRQQDVDRLKGLQIAGIQNEAVPLAVGRRIMPMLLYPSGHPYHRTFLGNGTSQSVQRIDRPRLLRYHDTWFRPDLSTLVIVGDLQMAQLKPQLEAAFGSWRPRSAGVASVPPPAPDGRRGGGVYIIDRPGAVQTQIFAALLVPPKGTPIDPATEVLNHVLGQGPTSRLFRNLREDKRWSYSVRSEIRPSRGAGILMLHAAVQADKSRGSVEEIRREVSDTIGQRPITSEELAAAKDYLTARLPLLWETTAGVGASAADMVRYNLPDDYWHTYAARVRSLTLEEVQRAATELMSGAQITWVLVGDAATIEPWAGELGLGTARRVNSDGQPSS
jgi:zinc protease